MGKYNTCSSIPNTGSGVKITMTTLRKVKQLEGHIAADKSATYPVIDIALDKLLDGRRTYSFHWKHREDLQ